ncbi:MAG: ferrous iron transport protein B [Saprospiraceae bacterium]|nr:ferrous iron transport protein B [Saprospiraceae bacterium]
MKAGRRPIVALLGNPNSGKSSLFNYLTGLHQDVSNFPGVTVDKKSGMISLSENETAEIIDFPGTYSVYPNSTEEKIVINTLVNPDNDNYPDLVIYVADATQLERHLLFATQIIDLGFPMIFVMNMVDLAEKDGKTVDIKPLEKYLGVKVICTSVRNGYQLDELDFALKQHLKLLKKPDKSVIYQLSDNETFVASRIIKSLGTDNLYRGKILAHHFQWIDFLTEKNRVFIGDLVTRSGFNDIRLQVQETMRRYDDYGMTVRQTISTVASAHKSTTDKIDEIITHRFLGPVFFFVIMFFIFQAIFSWASYPMDMIEEGFALAGAYLDKHLTDVWWTDLLVNGLLAGLGGVLVFVPQIAILFFLIALLEESGYMSRVVFMFDSIMQRFGMNGRSMVALISSGACAIPAIMSARTISNPKERLITILVSPLISCSARLPVYAVLIGFVVPQGTVLGIFNIQGFVFMGLYLLGILGALLSALFFKKILKSDGSSFLMIELPNYKPPIWKNVFLTVWEKVTSFVVQAGKVIVIISLVLWFLASFGPGIAMENAESRADILKTERQLDDKQYEHLKASLKIEASYIGHMGKWLEPAIAPLGFDWKIGIALITSFAAREVFVGTMATIYSIGSESDEKTIREKMAAEIRPGTDQMVYNTATALSLLVFYVFALQCMSTMAIVKRETDSWKWPIIQFLFMGILAYVSAFIVYQLFS